MKKLAKFLAVLFAVYWLLLAHVSLNFLDKTPPLSEISKNGKYKIILKDVYPVNPMGLYCLLTTDWSPIYFSLYDRNGYIGQSSPFACYGKWRDVPYRECKKICVTGILTNLLKGQQNAIIRRTHRPTAGGLLQP